jgi:hypothetical protein
MSNLDFIYDLKEKKEKKLQKFKFLDSNFEDNIWKIKYSNSSCLNINFNILLGDNNLLTSAKHEILLLTLKYWIIEGVQPVKGISYAPKTISLKIKNILSLFDYLNINDQHSQMSKFGFAGLTTDFIKFMFDELSSYTHKNESIYKISDVFTAYFRDNISPLKNNIKENNDYGIMGINNDKIDEFKAYILNNKDIKTSLLYKNCLSKPIGFPTELKSLSIKTIKREFKSFYRNNENKKLSTSALNDLLNCFCKIKNLKSINNISANIPELYIFDEILNYKPETKIAGRFETVPSSLIFETFKKAVEFHYNYGEDIIKSYENYIKNLEKNNISSNSFGFNKETEDILLKSLTRKIKNIGVKSWKQKCNGNDNKFNLLRDNKSLYDLIIVYFGAVQTVVGSLMARRQSELGTLSSDNCIDAVNNHLIFKRSKSTKNLFGIKDTLALPIDELGIEMIKKIKRFHQFNQNDNLLFAVPQYINPFQIQNNIDSTLYNEKLDIFFDYIEIPVKDGKRLYIRQHQLRRFFAMAFFWGNGFGSMDTLRWFMGHTDVKHLYHYITESVSGEVLRSTKAQYAAEHLDDFDNLKKLVEEKYNTSNINIIEEDDLIYFIEDLMEEGNIEIEPDFLEDNDGNEFKVTVTIKESGVKNEK